MKEITIIFSSSWKFAATFPVAVYLFNMSFFETLLYTNIGGLLGIIVFTILSKGLLKILNTLWPERLRCKRKSKKIFNRTNKRLILMKNKYGLPGIVVLTPVLLSIPLGVFLNTKYFGHKKISYLYLFLGQIAWSVVYTVMYAQVKMLL